jgi:hypothetical protein
MMSLIHVFLPTALACDPICAGMLQSMVWSSVAVVAIYFIARVTLGTISAALSTALLVLVSHGFWVYATQAEVYAAMVGCTFAATAVLFTDRAAGLSGTRVALTSALWALATLYHAASILLFLPFAVYFWGTQGFRGWRQLMAVSAFAGSIVVAAFAGAYAWAGGQWRGHKEWSLSDFFSWILDITDRPLTDYGSLSNLEPGGFVRTGWSLIKAVTLLPEGLTVSLQSPFDQLPLAIVGITVIAATLLWNVMKIFKNDLLMPRLYFMTMLVPNLIFFTWWSPSVHKFFILSAIAMIMLMAFALRDVYHALRRERMRWGFRATVAAAIALIFVFNLSSVLELRHSRGAFYAEAEVFNSLAPEGCIIYTQAHHVAALEYYLGKHNGANIVRLERDFFRFRRGEPGAVKPFADGEECVLIPLGYLSERRFDRMIGRFLPSAAWRDYIAYVLEVKDAPQGDGVTYSSFELVGQDDGRPDLLVDRRRRASAPSLEAVTGMIESEVDQALQKLGPPEEIEDYGDFALAIPRTGVVIGRDRNLIFGYGWGDRVRRALGPVEPRDG